MQVSAVKCFLQFILIGFQFFLWAAPVRATENLVSGGNAYFEIVGLDGRSVSYVNDLSRVVVEKCQPYLNFHGADFSPRILVALRPQAYADFAGDYAIRLGAQGFVSLDLKWEPNLGLSTVFRALTDAYLQRYAQFNFGPAVADRMSAWPARALGQMAYLKMRLAESVTLKRLLDAEPRIAVEQVLERSAHAEATDVVYWESYALLALLEQSGMTAASLRNCIESALRGAELSALLTVQFPELATANLQQWWLLKRKEVVISNNEWCESLSVSREWLENMAAFDSFREAGFEFKNLRELWPHREVPLLREMLGARLEIIKLRIAEVNPAYFNTARSLGTLFEALLEDAPKYIFIHALVDYMTAFEDAKLLERKTLQALER